MEFHVFLVVTAILFGAIIGSFLNVVILRLPNDDKSIVFPASHCPNCLEDLSWYENIPILSYLFLKGQCSHCKISISLQYPMVELFTALLYGAVIHRFGLSLTALGYLLFCSALVTIIWIDIYHQIIPDRISLPGIVLGFLFSFVNIRVTWLDSLFGLLAGGGILYAVAVLYYLLRKKEGMGGGDIKLLAMIGAFLGWQALLFVIFASSFIGSIVGILMISKQKEGSETRIPFGPFLSLAALTFLFFQENIFSFYQLYMNLTSQ